MHIMVYYKTVEQVSEVLQELQRQYGLEVKTLANGVYIGYTERFKLGNPYVSIQEDIDAMEVIIEHLKECGTV